MKIWLLAAAVVLGPSGTVFHERDKGCLDCGTVSAIQVRDFPKGKSVVLGTVRGGAQDAGAAPAQPGVYYRVTVDMDTGHTREVNVTGLGGLATGNKVRLVDGDIEAVAAAPAGASQ